MEIKTLKYFIEIAQNKSMTRAAQKLHITQPTLSRQIKLLEEKLGQKLFKRSNYHMFLTPEGEILYKYARDILDLNEKVILEFESMNEFNGGDISIGCAESDGISLLAQAMTHLNQQFDNIRFHLHSGNFNTIVSRIDHSLIDFAIVVQEIDTSAYNSIVLPYTDTWGLLMRRDDPLAHHKIIQIEQLKTLPLIVSRQGFTDEMPNQLKNIENQMHIIGTYDLIFNASIFVREGVGYALTFDKLITTNDDSPLVFVPIEPQITSPMKIIWPKEAKLSKTAELFLEELKSVIHTDHKA